VTIPIEVVEAGRTGKPLRLHRSDGEVLVLRVLHCDEQELVYAVYTSTHSERYGVCDSTGFRLAVTEIESVELLDRPPPRFRAVFD